MLIEAQVLGFQLSPPMLEVPEIVIDGETGKIVNDATGLSLETGLLNY